MGDLAWITTLLVLRIRVFTWYRHWKRELLGLDKVQCQLYHLTSCVSSLKSGGLRTSVAFSEEWGQLVPTRWLVCWLLGAVVFGLAACIPRVILAAEGRIYVSFVLLELMRGTDRHHTGLRVLPLQAGWTLQQCYSPATPLSTPPGPFKTL